MNTTVDPVGALAVVAVVQATGLSVVAVVEALGRAEARAYTRLMRQRHAARMVEVALDEQAHP